MADWHDRWIAAIAPSPKSVNPPFGAEHQTFREEVAAYVAGELRPRVAEWERACWFDHVVFEELAARGWLGLTQDPAYGGLGMDGLFGAVFSEEIARCGSAGVAAGIGAHIGIATPPIARFGTEDHKQRYLAPAIRAEKIAALAITEPGGGSDVAGARTHARRVDGGWVVNGSKTYITNGVRADFYVTAVRSRDEGGHGGMSFLIVDAGNGVSARKLDKLGWRASDTAEVFYDDVFVPEENLLGEEGKGFYLIMANFQGERLGMALMAVGEMRETLAAVLAHGGSGQAHRHAVAEMALTLEVSAAMSYDVLRRHAAGEQVVREVSMAKLFTQRASVDLAERALRLLGPDAYFTEGGVERALRDARLGPIGGGTDEIMAEIISRSYGL
jgi:acyl-CoA dehydrogenase